MFAGKLLNRALSNGLGRLRKTKDRRRQIPEISARLDKVNAFVVLCSGLAAIPGEAVPFRGSRTDLVTGSVGVRGSDTHIVYMVMSSYQQVDAVFRCNVAVCFCRIDSPQLVC